VLGGYAGLSLVQRGNGEYLAATATGGWQGPFIDQKRLVFPAATFVYGVATLPADVPRSGTALYEAEPYGHAAVASPGGDEVAYYSADAALNVDFGSQTATGSIATRAWQSDPEAGEPTGTYTLTQVVFAPDGTGFQARLMKDGVPVEGFLEARFTGASAREIMVRWVAAYQAGGRTGLAFGVWGAAKS
jgi:hypothetical protein